jgi:fucose permease
MSERDHDTPIALLHLSFLFTGAGVLLLGPLLPVYAQTWHLRDAQSGLLIAAQFLGLFAGSVTLGMNLRGYVLLGYGCATGGFLALAATLHFDAGRGAGFPIGLAALFLGGFGLGQVTTGVQLIAARRLQVQQRRSASLSLLNFTWSAGAVLSPLVAGLALRHGGALPLLLAFPVLALVLAVAIALDGSSTQRGCAEPAKTEPGVGLGLLGLTYYIGFFFLYGGMEATVSGWLSTYTLRYTSLGLTSAAFGVTLLWASFTVSRAVAAAILRHVPERALRTYGIALAGAAAVFLRGTRTGVGVDVCACLIGLGLGPLFPITLSLMMAYRASPRQAGIAMANVGLGSAAFAYLTGLLSSRSGSLQLAMFLPAGLALGLLAMTRFQQAGTAAGPAHKTTGEVLY